MNALNTVYFVVLVVIVKVDWQWDDVPRNLFVSP